MTPDPQYYKTWRKVGSERSEGRGSGSGPLVLEEVGTRMMRGSAHCLSLRDGGSGGDFSPDRSLRQCAHSIPAP